VFIDGRSFPHRERIQTISTDFGITFRRFKYGQDTVQSVFLALPLPQHTMNVVFQTAIPRLLKEPLMPLPGRAESALLHDFSDNVTVESPALSYLSSGDFSLFLLTDVMVEDG